MPESPEGPFREPTSETPTTTPAPTETRSPHASTEVADPLPPADAASSEPPYAEGDEDDLPIEAWKLILGVVAAFVVVTLIGLVAFVAFGSDDESNNGDGENASAGPDSTAGSGATLADGFDRPDSSDGLGTADTGQKWETISGVWGIKDQQAALIEANPDGNRSLAVIDMGASSGTIQATGPQMSNGWGLVFRYRSPFNFWYISGSEEYASYSVVKVTRPADSEEITTEVVRQINLANAKDGAVVKIVLRGEAIEIYLDGKLREQIFDPALSAQTQVGLLAVGEGPVDARWDDFTATPDLTVAVPLTSATTTGLPAASNSIPAGGESAGTTIDVPAPTVNDDQTPPTTEAGGDGAAEDGG